MVSFKDLHNIGLALYRLYYAMEVTVLTYRSVYFDRRVHNPGTFATNQFDTGFSWFPCVYV